MVDAARLPVSLSHTLRPGDQGSNSKSLLAKPLNVVKYNSTGQYFLTAGNDKKVHLYNATSASHIKTYEAHGYEIVDLAVSHDNARFASVGGDKPVYYWDVAAGTTLRRFAGHTQRVNAVAMSPDSSVVVSGSFDASVRLWDTKSNSQVPIQILDDAKDSITSLFVQDYQVITGSTDGIVRKYDLRRGLLTKDVLGQSVTSIQQSKDGQTLLISTLDSTIRLLDNSNGGLLQEYTGHANQGYRIPSIFDDVEEHVISGSEDGRILMWNHVTGKTVQDISAHDGKVVSGLAVHPKGIQMATCGGNGQVNLWIH